MRLFEHRSDTSNARKSHRESKYDFYARVCDWPDMVDARVRMERWFSRLPHEAKAQVRQRMRKGRDVDFDSCFFELLLHEYLLRSGWKVELHPNLPAKSRTPDFLAVSPAGGRLIVEATLVTDKSDDDRRTEGMQGQVLDVLNSIPNVSVSLAILDLEVKTDQVPSLSRLKAFVTERIAEAESNTEALEELVWIYETKRLRVQMSPIRHSGKAEISTVGMGPTKCRFGGPESAILSTLRKKATRYGPFEGPYVIAINVISEWAADLECVTRALFGAGDLDLASGNSFGALPSNLPDSLWMSGCSEHRTISGVLATRVFPHSVCRAPIRVYHNPLARHPLPVSGLPGTGIRLGRRPAKGAAMAEIFR